MKLPEYVSQPLANSPLVLVAAQINYEEVVREVAHDQARRVQKALGQDWTTLTATPLVQATLTPDGAVNQPNRQAYRLGTADGVWSVLLNPSSASLETTAYSGWDAFHGRFASLAAAVSQVFDPATEQRLGLRYIDQIPLPEGRQNWRGLVPDSLLGISLDEQFADAVLGSDQRLLLRLDADTSCVLRHGLLTDQTTGQRGAAYLLDYDVYRENRTFDADGVINGVDLLHSYVGGLFLVSITDDLYAILKG